MRYNIIFIILILLSCTHTATKFTERKRPKFTNTQMNDEIQVIYDEFNNLSYRHNLHFQRNIDVGFTDINKGNVIGYCTFGSNFREITIDPDYWSDASWMEKIALVYHELVHCRCGRDHTYGNGEYYPLGGIGSMFEDIMNKYKLTPVENKGYLEDACPSSIMHPVIVNEECFIKHYGYYVDEMFNHCSPY